ncbi:MAG: hypothetical protein ACRDUW_03475 [Pseudonocardiaceae bacterium]
MALRRGDRWVRWGRLGAVLVDMRERGTAKINADFRMLATGVNLARLATLGLRFTTTGWAVPA